MKKALSLLTFIGLTWSGQLLAFDNNVLLPRNQKAIERMNQYVLETVSRENIQGMSLSILVNGKAIHQKSFGIADRKLKTPIDETTSFPIASITKLFVSTAVHELLLLNNISTESNIGQFLDSIPNHWKQIKLKNLLSHTSGLPDYYLIDSEPSTTIEAIELVGHLPLEYETGKQSKYNQTGFALLHLLVEELSGVSLKEYLRTNHFAKFNLPHTYYSKGEVDVGKTTKTYRKTWSGIHDFKFLYPPSVYGSAGLNSSSEDLTKWIEAVLNGQVLSLENLSRIWASHTLTNGKNSGFSLGWEFYETDSLYILGHGGADTSEVRHFINKVTGDSVTVIWLSNTLGFDPHESVNKIASFLIDGIPGCSTFLIWQFDCELN